MASTQTYQSQSSEQFLSLAQLVLSPQSTVALFISAKTEEGAPVIVLTKRAQSDSWADALLQPSTHGKLKPEELSQAENCLFSAYNNALIREVGKELGDNIQELIKISSSKIQLINAICEQDENNQTILRITYFLNTNFRSTDFKNLAVLEQGVSLYFIKPEEAQKVQPLEKDHKQQGVPDGEFRMFQDQIMPLKTAFSLMEEKKFLGIYRPWIAS
ncbi:MAG TPA: hypothetical protein PKD37_03560 [Oligoflexia bacterium]|nr:hypothetical protein [Oligoflexia bacterium]HMP27046.1 hypothetical protein [Oligoflexia bacterium]